MHFFTKQSLKPSALLVINLTTGENVLANSFLMIEKRLLSTDTNDKFNYGREELVAELISALSGVYLGISVTVREENEETIIHSKYLHCKFI